METAENDIKIDLSILMDEQISQTSQAFDLWIEVF